MPSETRYSPALRTPGLRVANRVAWSDNGMHDHHDSWIECTRCGGTLFHSEGDFPESNAEVDAIEFLHSTGLCLIADVVARVLQRRVAALAARVAPAGGEEPF